MKQAMATFSIFNMQLLGLLFINLHQSITPKFDQRLITQEEIAALVCEAQKEDARQPCQEDLLEIRSVNPKKSWTVICYMAADNNLHYFAWKNLKQMEQIGSNENINIIAQLNTPGYLNPTKRYVIKKGRRILVDDATSPASKLNSGSPHTLIDCVSWGVRHYPADNYALFFWNHGSAAIDPNFSRTINPCDLFYCNPTDNMLEIDRGISYITLLSQVAASLIYTDEKRGICFDDTFKSYISNAELDFALKEICTKALLGKKFGLVLFDACLMSMIEISSIVQKYADYMTTSQEVVYGTGKNYELLFKPFLQQSLSPKEFAQHIVLAYEQTYQKIINDYTFSALDLSLSSRLEQNVDQVASVICQALAAQHNYSVSNMLRKCKSTQFCTCFDEPSYIDLADFYTNVLKHMQHISLRDKNLEKNLQNKLTELLNQGLDIISQMVIENRVGQKLSRARGISIYFPEHSIAHNYPKSPFALSNSWSQLLQKYILK
ncbi:hypothetical protein A3J41_00605 [candidate division TM6 bacterium RIFCSPHIGHO2_12_FULL_38_8]|nr:MAG: hypothetical protein A3J41_00605 [candidate division TM6 bacterium RIFCSPHIGHO2_12_FULL_38_8]